MSATLEILKLDARGVTRDNVIYMNVGLSFVGMLVITAIGYYKGDTEWARWFPFLVIMALLTNPPGYGFLFGLLMVDERDSGVRGALAVTPVPQGRMLVIRTLTSIAMLLVWPMITIYVMNSTWKAIDLSFLQWFMLAGVLSLMGPVTALSVASYATNKVEALALFKGINMAMLAPLALYFLPEGAAYRELFLILPATWSIFAFDALRAGTESAYFWLAGGALYHLGLLAVSMWWYLRTLYKDAS
jgi:fluoroquinolone transport system permease protein